MYGSKFPTRVIAGPFLSRHIIGQSTAASRDALALQIVRGHRRYSTAHSLRDSTQTRLPTRPRSSQTGSLVQKVVPSRPDPPPFRSRTTQPEIWPEDLFPSLSPDLSQEQKHILNKVLEGESVFFTGSAGTGKSVLLRAIINALGGPSETVAVTASTGIAAVNIGGETLHSFAGTGLGNTSIERLTQKVRRRWENVQRWCKVKVLIIDEISMVDATWFDCLEEIARRIRKIKKPFGGIQLVVCGDFFQLPPVPDHEVSNAPASFVFDAFTWDKCIKSRFALNQVFRQKDPKLIKLLNDARIGVVSPESARLLRSLARPVRYSDNIGPTEIYPVRYQADAANQRQLAALPGEPVTYSARDHHGKDGDGKTIPPERAAKLLGGMIVPRTLQLKVGAQVMCVRNVRDVGVVNGSSGRVVGFMRPEEFRGYAMNNPQWKMKIISSLEPKPNEDKQTLPQPQVHASVPGRTTQSKKERDIYEKKEWPVVEFPNGIRALMGPVVFTSETKNGEVEARRTQVPLILAWALTVHKAQGQTLDRVKIDLRRIFERGQAYVALSRCTSLERLEVYNFDERAVVAHPRVQQWSKNLATLDRMLVRVRQREQTN